VRALPVGLRDDVAFQRIASIRSTTRDGPSYLLTSAFNKPAELQLAHDHLIRDSRTASVFSASCKTSEH
jgi:hypothetical protein